MKPGKVYSAFKMKNGRVAILRTLRRNDLPSLVRWVNSFVREKAINKTLGVALDKRATMRSEAKWLKRMLEGVKRGDVISVAAEVEGEIVGNSDIVRRTFSGEARHTATLGIAILPSYRGVGLGEAMMKTLLSEARKAGISIVELDVFEVNKGARHLYRKLGFRDVGVVPRKIRRRGRYFDVVAMYTDLGSG